MEILFGFFFGNNLFFWGVYIWIDLIIFYEYIFFFIVENINNNIYIYIYNFI